MFMFGINLPVAEILSVAMILVIIVLVFIALQLRQLKRHAKILNETTLEIRRYEDEEAVTLRRFETDPEHLNGGEKSRFKSQFLGAAATLDKAAAARLLQGVEPVAVKAEFMSAGLGEVATTRAVNNAAFLLDAYSALTKQQSDSLVKRMKAAARKK